MSVPDAAPAEVIVQWMWVDGWQQHHQNDAIRWLTLAEQQRMHGFRVNSARAEFVAARWLLRSTLSTHFGEAPQCWTFNALPGGKLVVCTPAEVQAHISLSHAAGVVTCAVSRHRQVGVDIERSRARSIDPTLAERYFAAEEARALRETACADRADAFCRLWTLKEAYLKGLGIGLARDLDSFAIIDEHTGPTVHDTAPDPHEPTWHLWHCRMAPDVHLALAAAGRSPLSLIASERAVLDDEWQ